MNLIVTQELTLVWNKLQSLVPIYVIYNEQQYTQALELLDQLLDIVQDDENHPLYNLLDTLSVLVQNYEEKSYPAPSITGIEVLKFLINEHQLTLSSFPEIGNAEVVADLLAGKRELTVAHIRALAHRFGLSPATFF